MSAALLFRIFVKTLAHGHIIRTFKYGSRKR